MERKIQDAEALNDSMQAEISRVRMQHADLQEDMRSRDDNERQLEQELRTALEEAQRHGQSMEHTLRAQLDNHQQQAKRREDKLLQQVDEHKKAAAVAQAAVPMGRQVDEGAMLEWKNRCESLERELDSQRRITDDTRAEMGTHLREMRDLAVRGAESVEREEQYLSRIEMLEREVLDWKARCASAKSGGNGMSQSDNEHSRSITKDVTSSGYAQFMSEGGSIKDVNLSHFQLSIDDLLKQARTSDQRALEEGMRAVVVCVRNITSDMETASKIPDDQSRRAELRGRLSAAANNLITATKAHSSASGLAPVGLVDAAAGHLTAAVVDVVRVFKVQKASSSTNGVNGHSHEEEDMAFKPAPLRTKSSLSDLASNRGHPQQHGHQLSQHSQKHDRNVSVNSSGGYSVYSRYSERNSSSNVTSPNGAMETAIAVKPFMGMLREDPDSEDPMSDFSELRASLEDSNAALVRAIQPLVNTVRSGGPPSSATDALIASHISSIDNIVRAVAGRIDSASGPSGSGRRGALAKHTRPVVDSLQDASFEMSRLAEQGPREREGLPRVAFGIARLMKDVIWRVEKIGNGELSEKDGAAGVEL
jgi:hypothetical protein